MQAERHLVGLLVLMTTHLRDCRKEAPPRASHIGMRSRRFPASALLLHKQRLFPGLFAKPPPTVAAVVGDESRADPALEERHLASPGLAADVTE
jgi:hypothetical protein